MIEFEVPHDTPELFSIKNPTFSCPKCGESTTLLVKVKEDLYKCKCSYWRKNIPGLEENQ